MTAEAFVSLLDRPRQTSRGWIACCPSHKDRRPSLAISDGERGVLLKCWAGCTVEHITAAMGVSIKDLFYDTNLDTVEYRAALKQRQAERANREQAYAVQGLASDLLREAERLTQSARNIDITQWSNEELNHRLNDLADAYAVLEKEEENGRTV
jgi:hypothetical protein